MSQRKQSGDLYRVKRKQGTHLASSHDTDGALRGILLDDKTNKLVAHAELEKVDESEDECDYSNDYRENQQQAELSPEMQKLAQFLGEALAAATFYAVKEYVAPPVKRWLQNKAIPTMKETWKILTDRTNEKPSQNVRKKTQLQTSEIVTANETVQDMFSHVLEEKYRKYMHDMTSEEAQRELLDIFILSALLTTKLRKLSNARIKKKDGAPEEYLEGQKILEMLTTPKFLDSINQILENNPHLMEEKTTDLSDIVGRSLVINGQYVPIEIGKLKEALYIPNSPG